jgi:ABC-type glycerol-3-phosphate transport system substrate-binding protein
LAFTKGIAGMIATSTSYLFPFDRDVPKWFEEGKIAATGIPVNVPGREGTWIGYNSLVAVKGPREAQAKQFIRFVIRTDVAAKYFSSNVAGHVPALEEVYKNSAFWMARARFKSTYEAAYQSVKASKWDEPIVPWSGLFFSKNGYDKVMENVYVNKWSTDKVMNWLIRSMIDVKEDWK